MSPLRELGAPRKPAELWRVIQLQHTGGRIVVQLAVNHPFMGLLIIKGLVFKVSNMFHPSAGLQWPRLRPSRCGKATRHPFVLGSKAKRTRPAMVPRAEIFSRESGLMAFVRIASNTRCGLS